MTSSNTRNVIFLSGYFGCGNVGDDLLLSAAVAQLRVVIPCAHFFIRDSGDVAPFGDLGADVTFTGVDTILGDRRISRPRRLIRFFVRLTALLRQCRWLIFAGGTVFHEHNNAHSLILQWSICRLARLLGVRTAALGVGVADLHSSRGRWLVRDIVRMSDLFLVRDEASLRQCADTRARLTEDIVFGWSELLAARPSRACAGRPRTIALAVSPFAFEGEAEERAVAAFSDAIRTWHSRGHRVVFLVFHKEGLVAGDRAMFERIADRIGPEIPAEVRVLAAAPRTLAAAYRDIDILCGMRFHGFVLAALFGIPFAGITHDGKISEICRRFGMPCFDADTFEGTILAEAAASLPLMGPASTIVERSIVTARENFSALAKVIV